MLPEETHPGHRCDKWLSSDLNGIPKGGRPSSEGEFIWVVGREARKLGAAGIPPDGDRQEFPAGRSRRNTRLIGVMCVLFRGERGPRAGDHTRSVAVPGFHGDLPCFPPRSRIAAAAVGPRPGGRLWQPGGVCPCPSAPRAAHALPVLYPGALGNTSLRRIGVLLIERAGNPLCRQQGGVHKRLEPDRSDLSGPIFYNSPWQQCGRQTGEKGGIGEGPARRSVQ